MLPWGEPVRLGRYLSEDGAHLVDLQEVADLLSLPLEIVFPDVRKLLGVVVSGVIREMAGGKKYLESGAFYKSVFQWFAKVYHDSHYVKKA